MSGFGIAPSIPDLPQRAFFDMPPTPVPVPVPVPAPVPIPVPVPPANIVESNGNGVVPELQQFVPPPVLNPLVGAGDIGAELPSFDQGDQLVLGQGAKREAPVLGIGLPRLSSRQADDLTKAKKYAMEQSIKHVLLKQTLQHQQQHQKVAMYAHALSLMSRIYIGSVSFEVREDTVKSSFSVFGPIKSISMSWDPITGHHKGFAFLEYEIPEAASLAQEQMDNVLMGGRNLKVGRPSNMPQAQPIIDSISEEAKKYNRIYVSSVHTDISENDLRSVFEAFGKIKSCELCRLGPHSPKHKGYGYIEYETMASALDAIASMNLFDLGGQYLRVGRAVTPPQTSIQGYIPPAQTALPTAAAVAAAAATAKIQALEASTGGGGLGSKVSAAPIMGGVFAVPPPGLAIPQLPPQPQVVMPQLYSMPAPQTPPVSGTGSPVQNLSPTPTPPPAQPSVAAPTPTPAQTPVFRTPAVPPPQERTPTAPLALCAPGEVGTVAVLPSKGPKEPAAKKKKPGKGGKPEPPKAATDQPANPQAQAELLAAQLRGSDSVAARLLASGTLSDKQKQLIEQEAGQSLAAQEDLKIKGNEARNILMHKLMRRTESMVLVLRNMVGPEDMDDDLEGEVVEECSKYGQVERVVIYQEDQGQQPALVKIFVVFSLASEVEVAKNSLNGRFFGGRQIKADTYDQNLFDHQDLTG